MLATKWRGGWIGRGAGLAIATLIASAGCGGSGPPNVATYKVDGQVLLADGKPLTTGHVTFVPTQTEGAALPASGEIGADGRFSLTTRAPGDGAAVGDYRVRIDVPPTPTPRGKSNRPFPQKYTDIDNTDIAVSIKAGSNTLDPFVLK